MSAKDSDATDRPRNRHDIANAIYMDTFGYCIKYMIARKVNKIAITGEIHN
jgi:hypothetical protein